ncbi:tRNA(Ser) Um(44) 2'-O-methyltransferase [Diaporthe australafricana]|uniref:tRNA (uracil-O(2)-)-methyltransferase n=1 Tax=Diaporthe australafricana TaxID=127596 RepID=A0ABR3WEB9_9PEZI
MPFEPDDLSDGGNKAAAVSCQILDAGAGSSRAQWTPLFKHGIRFEPAIFDQVMLNLITNPNINSSWLFRADILLDQVSGSEVSETSFNNQPQVPSFLGLEERRRLVRRMIPRNELRDKPLEQTCVFYQGTTPQGLHRSLIIYLPHSKSESDIPFYHPAVRGVAFLHEWNPEESRGTVSIHYCFFEGTSRDEKITRTALNLLRVTYKHGEGQLTGYEKRVRHDVLVPQAALQNRYATLKQKYARSLVEGWEETTDPGKHVFEDICIAAFLIELWQDMYKDSEFPGWVDIGCGNGLLTHILNSEDYPGWGFDARARKSWPKYSTEVRVRTPPGSFVERQSLETRILLPSVINGTQPDGEMLHDEMVHNGIFPPNTFIISNHADELTPWTPILARLSDCPFIMIPCCSHNLTGARFRAPPPKNKAESPSMYNSLCAWVTEIARDCGWEVEKEMLRIPSTRNAAFVGRRLADDSELDVQALLNKYGGTQGYYDNVSKLLKVAARGH